MNPASTPISRNEFLKTSSAALLAASTLGFPSILRGAGNSDKLKIGFIGCGGRGTGAANQALKADSNVVLWSMGDAFEDKLQTSLEGLRTMHTDKVDVPKERQFVGLDAYQKVIDSGVDVVLLTSPPAFRPQQKESLVPEKLDWEMKLPVAPVAMPGITPFI